MKMHFPSVPAVEITPGDCAAAKANYLICVAPDGMQSRCMQVESSHSLP